MLQSLNIKNYRGFRDLTVRPLGRVNLIAGKNNTGKSSLLEAIYLLVNPDLDKAIDEIQRMRFVEVRHHSLVENLAWFFPSKRLTENVVRIQSIDDRGTERAFTLESTNAEAVAERLKNGDESVRDLASMSFWSNIFVARYMDGTKEQSRRFFDDISGGQVRGRFQREGREPSRFVGSSPSNDVRVIEDFSEVELSNRQQIDVLPALHLAFGDKLTRLALAQVDGENTIHGAVGLDRMIPISYMGEGMRRLLSIVLAIANCHGGVVLIDEVENGLHHSVMEKVWEVIGKAASDNHVQVFATTHSYECIQAAHEAFSRAKKYDLRLHRLDRVEDQIKSVTFDEETLETAVEMFVEVR